MRELGTEMFQALPHPSAQLVAIAQSALVFLVALIVSLVIRHYALAALRRPIPETELASRILKDSLEWPSLLWCIVSALLITLEYADLPSVAAKWARGGSFVFLVVSICVVTSSLIVKLVVYASQRRGLTIGMSGVSRSLVHVFVMSIGAAIIGRYFNVTIAPILTALGVGGLAVALALRDTLANFFAGIHIIWEAPISVGDFVHLSSGEEGTVSDIGWRTTRILTGSNNTVVIPNEKITSSILTNFAMPEPAMMTELVILTGFEVDIEQVTAILVEEAALVPDVMEEFTPLVLFDPGMTPTHLGFKVIVRVPHRLKAGMVQSGIRRRAFERFRKDGIPLPSVEQISLYKAR